MSSIQGQCEERKGNCKRVNLPGYSEMPKGDARRVSYDENGSRIIESSETFDSYSNNVLTSSSTSPLHSNIQEPHMFLLLMEFLVLVVVDTIRTDCLFGLNNPIHIIISYSPSNLVLCL